jgi:hypothetical protein
MDLGKVPSCSVDHCGRLGLAGGLLTNYRDRDSRSSPNLVEVTFDIKGYGQPSKC